MDRSDVLAALVTAQRDLALHLDTARTELISLPHQLADLQPMKTVMGSYMGQRIPHARILAEELWAGDSHYGSSTTDLVPPMPLNPAGDIVPYDENHPQWVAWLTQITTNIGSYTFHRMVQHVAMSRAGLEAKFDEGIAPTIEGIARVTGILATTHDAVCSIELQ